jgi:hypothetical protein
MTRTTRTMTAIAAVLLALGACTTAPEPTPTPTPEPTGPWPAADIAPLTPPDPAPSDLEQTTAVQVIRETMIVLAWANLTNTSHFAQFTQWIDPASRTNAIGLDDEITEKLNEYPWVAVGPDPWVPLALTENADGTLTVRTCGPSVGEIEVSKADGTPAPPASA